MVLTYSSGELYLVYTHKDHRGDTICTPVAHPIMPGYKQWKIRGAKRSEEQLSIDGLETLGDVSLITFKKSSSNPIVLDTIANVESLAAARDVARTWVDEFNKKDFPSEQYDPKKLDQIASQIPATTETKDEEDSPHTASSDDSFAARYKEIRKEIASNYN